MNETTMGVFLLVTLVALIFGVVILLYAVKIGSSVRTNVESERQNEYCSKCGKKSKKSMGICKRCKMSVCKNCSYFAQPIVGSTALYHQYGRYCNECGTVDIQENHTMFGITALGFISGFALIAGISLLATGFAKESIIPFIISGIGSIIVLGYVCYHKNRIRLLRRTQ